jgi:hypothetical protein
MNKLIEIILEIYHKLNNKLEMVFLDYQIIVHIILILNENKCQLLYKIEEKD